MKEALREQYPMYDMHENNTKKKKNKIFKREIINRLISLTINIKYRLFV